MTLKEVQKLSDEEIRIKVAELCGWHSVEIRPYVDTKNPLGVEKGQAIWPHTLKRIPNYPQDLNAMHEAEKLLPEDMDTRCLYADFLTFTTDGIWRDAKRRFECATATARQRAEAFALTMEVVA